MTSRFDQLDAFPGPVQRPSLDRMIECVGREIGMRRKVYPGLVRARRMEQAEAHEEIQTMQAIYRLLANLRDNRL